MNLFLTWANDRSCKIAEALRDAITSVFEHRVVPMYSPVDIPKGLIWFEEIVGQLNRADIGIACLTPESLKSPWLHLEIGVLYQVLRSTKSAVKGDVKILPFLFEFELMKEQFGKHPLSHFQCTFATKQDTRNLFQTINESLETLGESPLTEEQLSQRFNENWETIERQLTRLASANMPVYGAYQHQLDLATGLSETIHGIISTPALTSNVCFQKLVANTVDEATARLKQFAKRGSLLRSTIPDFIGFLHNLCAETRISIKALSILNDQDVGPPPIEFDSVDLTFDSADCTTIVSSLKQAQQLIEAPRNQLRQWELRLMTQDNYQMEFPRLEDWFCLVGRDGTTELVVKTWSARTGTPHELIASAKHEEIETRVKLWNDVHDRAIPIPSSPTTKDVVDTLDAIAKPLRFKVTEPKLIAIQGGEFQMGSPANEAGRFADEVLHAVTIPYDFAIGKFPITFEQYDEFVQAKSRRRPESTAEERRGDPVSNVSWNEAMDYAAWLSENTGKNYGLPTEAEWEYAARAGQLDKSGGLGPEDGICLVDAAIDRNGLLAVGQLPANRWGLRDCLGNIWEWTCSCYAENYGGAETMCAALDDRRKRVARGGAWTSPRRELRYAMRKPLKRYHASADVGFRVVCRS